MLKAAKVTSAKELAGGLFFLAGTYEHLPSSASACLVSVNSKLSFSACMECDMVRMVISFSMHEICCGKNGLVSAWMECAVSSKCI
jgi:hypothetical protein